ncbi:MAG: hypothetical protein HGA90_03050 [Alphaproteobacteria bacterium]|nr:hypothetical protein [Alphaproteobacteria bacterium]
MPKASFIGDVYTEAPPEGRTPHPQDKPRAELYRVEGYKGDNGVYIIPVRVSESWSVRKVFLDQAQKVTNPLPEREGLVPVYGQNELVLDPSTKGVVNPTRNPELHKTVVDGMRRFHTSTTLDFQ